ncbi:hypothetical protein FGG08_005542 [Glutinoglossum americanum]|uniref:Uncharacterized protein n=1 Tax=Glutinoglossum americanum TaxID=1670608 RepID=A0A9P8I316_9PEZI|nr:hypothetical protein FGG08_005542 [Glutinoglossum americanum]
MVQQEQQKASPSNYKGFVAGVFSGIGKLTVGHPFDTVKVRLQTTQTSQFRGPLDCLLQTIRKEGVQGLYKGATPPLVGWMFMDSIMLGSLTYYRRLLNENIFNPTTPPLSPLGIQRIIPPQDQKAYERLPTLGHAIAGVMAGATVSFVAAPVEHIKARLQVQYAVDKTKRLYSGPINCAQKIYSSYGLPGIYQGLSATLLFRSFFFFWWGSYDIFTRLLTQHTTLSTPAINFWAGGLSAQVFWITSYPSDVVKQRIMTDSLGRDRRFAGWGDAARAVWRENGVRGYWRLVSILFGRLR